MNNSNYSNDYFYDGKKVKKMYPCAGGCGAQIQANEVFCKGCHWAMTMDDISQNQTNHVENLVQHGRTLIFRTYTTNPFFRVA